MPTMSPVPKDSPLMISWDRYEGSEEYQNSFKWAGHEEHRKGSMWAAFSAGFAACEATLERQRDEARDAIRNLIKAKGRHNTKLAYQRLEALAREGGGDE